MNVNVLLALVLLIATPAKAISAADSASAVEFQDYLQQTSARLELSDAQRAELAPILRTRFEVTRALLEHHGVSPSSNARPNRRALLQISRELSALRKATDAHIVAILSEEQRVTYRQIQDEQRTQIRSKVLTGQR